MKNTAPIILILLGLLLLYTGITGRTGVMLAAIFNPEDIDLNAERSVKEKLDQNAALNLVPGFLGVREGIEAAQRLIN